MDENIRKEILSILDRAIKIMNQGEDVSLLLSALSNDAIHDASITQDDDCVKLAIMMYSLSKIYTRGEGKINSNLLKYLTRAKKLVEIKQDDRYRNIVTKILHNIKKVDKKLLLYVQQVNEQAGIKKGSGLYDMGLSVAQSSSVVGVNQWQLYNYIGKTRSSEQYEMIEKWRLPIKKRLEFTRQIFGM